MMDFMREGGAAMWAILAGAVLSVALAATRPVAQRAAILVTGSMATLVQGVLGMATGLWMVSRNYQRFPNPVEAIGTGIGEASHNGSFAGVLALVLGVAALVSARQAAAREG